MTDWIVVGRLASPYGVKGWLKLMSYTEPMENIAEYEPVWVAEGKTWKQVSFEQVEFHGKGLVAKLAGCPDRTAAEAYVGRDIAIRRDQLPVLPDGEFYWSQLEGLDVYTTSGQWLGRVHHFLETGANDVMVVRPVEGSLDDRERLVPYVPDHHVMDVSLDQRRILVDWDPDF